MYRATRAKVHVASDIAVLLNHPFFWGVDVTIIQIFLRSPYQEDFK
jgi:hypothetical protein